MTLKEAKRRQRANYIISNVSLLLVAAVIVIGSMLANVSAIARQTNVKRIRPDRPNRMRTRTSALKFAEVEIVLSGRLGLADISALPRAPGSDLQVLDGPRRVRVQLPAGRVKALVDEDADVTVLKRFVLVEGFADQADTLDAGAMTSGSCSGPYRYGSDSSNVYIPDGTGEWVYSEITISGAPAGATVSCIDVHYEIIHTWVTDLVVDLSDENLTYEYNLFDDMYSIDENINETETGITAFNGEAVKQIWLLWAADYTYHDSGYIDYWWLKVYYDDAPEPPANDNCSDAIAVAEDEPYTGSTAGATGAYESYCGYNDTADVWHSYTPTSTGLVTISLSGSTFDTTLAVFEKCGGTELACNDDSCESYQSEIMMSMTAANTYLIRVAGYNGAIGDYTLTITSNPCILPLGPNSPSPGDGAIGVSADAVLFWNSGKAYGAGSSKSVMSGPKNIIIPKVIYGEDDRLDWYEVKDPDILTAGDSTVALIFQSELIDNGDGTFSLPAKTYAEWYEWLDPIGTGNPLCSDEPFRDQPAPAWGSGFLVAPDIIATVGHAACPDDCANMAVVFGFVMLDADTPVLTIDESQIYYCSEVIARQAENPDWALIRLDRQVTDHSPLPVRTEGIVPDEESLFVIGHPVGLPRKYAAGATVRDNTASSYFQANLDTYAGNSGSAVFNADTLDIEGILCRGNENFVEDGDCDRSNVCPDTGCPDWEDITRATEFSDLLGRQKYDVYFDSSNPPTELICSNVDVPMCSPAVMLMPCTTYYWQVVTKNSCGQVQGPVWSFTAASVPADFDGDCKVDLKDLAMLVSYWLEDEPSVNIAAPDDIIDFSDFAALADYWLRSW